MSSQEILDRYRMLPALAREAGAIAMRHFRQEGLTVESKGDASPVTIADRSAEQHLRKRISELFPRDGILGEEFGESAGSTGVRWILDPIDGTKSFIHGTPLWGVLLGVEFEARSVAGAIYIPPLDELAYAAEGEGAWLELSGGPPRPARVSARSRLAESLFCTSDVKTFVTTGREDAYRRLQAAAWLTRTWGDCYGYLLVATGRAEVMIDPKMNVWDCAALQPILEEAGGTFTDWRGNATIHAGESIATNSRVLEEVLSYTRTA